MLILGVQPVKIDRLGSVLVLLAVGKGVALQLSSSRSCVALADGSHPRKLSKPMAFAR